MDIYQVLQELHIPYEKFEHPAVHTVADAAAYDHDMGAGSSKNLFLRNGKEDTYYLVVIESSKRLDIKKLEKTLGERELRFASPEKLLEYLGLTPGSVSPFGLINDSEKRVHVIVDSGLLRHNKLGYHPNINTATLVIRTEDLKKFLSWTGNPVSYMEL